MKIILEQEDLNKVLTGYVETLGMDLTGKEVSVSFTAGRGPNGDSATVTITSVSCNTPEPVQKESPKKVAKKTTKKKTATKTPAEALLETAETGEIVDGEIVDPFADSAAVF